MSTTYKQIGTAQVVGSGGAANITFSDIPSTFTDLIIKISGRDNRSGQILDDIRFIVNNNTTGIYTMTRIAAFPTSGIFSGTSGTNVAEAGAGFVTADSATTSIFGNSEFYIPNYAGNTIKSASVDGVSENNAGVSGLVFNAVIMNTTAPITSVRLQPFGLGATAFYEHTTAYIYGVKNA
jgi:hypothetical protein